MCGDAEPRSERNFYVRKVGSAVNAPCGIMVVTGNEKINFRGGSGRELVAVVGDVIGMSAVRNVVPGGNGECVCKRVE